MNPIADRIAEVRRDIYGEADISALVDSLDLPRGTWMNYESGVVMPASVLLRFIDPDRRRATLAPGGRGSEISGPAERARPPAHPPILGHQPDVPGKDAPPDASHLHKLSLDWEGPGHRQIRMATKLQTWLPGASY